VDAGLLELEEPGGGLWLSGVCWRMSLRRGPHLLDGLGRDVVLEADGDDVGDGSHCDELELRRNELLAVDDLVICFVERDLSPLLW
jgi:hypothetical protein